MNFCFVYFVWVSEFPKNSNDNDRQWRISVDPRRGRFSVKMCAKTKELGPVGGCERRHRPQDPPVFINFHQLSKVWYQIWGIAVP